MIIPKILTEKQIAEIHEDLNKLCEPKLTVELETIDFRAIIILEVIIRIEKEGFTENWNKNYFNLNNIVDLSDSPIPPGPL